jgi:putative acetyltransferase
MIRPERPGDNVRDVVLRAFDGKELVADLADALRSSDAYVDGMSFVAEDRGELVGQAMLTRALVDAPQRLVDVLVLSPIGVVPDRQRGGVGTALLRHACAAADERAEPLIFLEGDPGYYARQGFEPAGALGFRRPSLRIPPSAFQVRRLAAYRPWMTGTLVYPAPFWNLDAVGLRDS